MSMPFRTLQMMFFEALRLESIEYRELLDISITPAMKLSYFYDRRNRYEKMIDPSPKQPPPRPPEFLIKAESKEARDAIFSVFRRAKRGR